MDVNPVWLALGLTAVTQLVGVGFIYGSLQQSVKGLRKMVERHMDARIPQAHDCLAFRQPHNPEQSQPTSPFTGS